MSENKEQFIFFCTNGDCESLLKTEIETNYKFLSPSFSSKGFLTYINKGHVNTLSDLHRIIPAFTTRMGLCIGSSKKANLKKKVDFVLKEYKLVEEEVCFHVFSQV